MDKKLPIEGKTQCMMPITKLETIFRHLRFVEGTFRFFNGKAGISVCVLYRGSTWFYGIVPVLVFELARARVAYCGWVFVEPAQLLCVSSGLAYSFHNESTRARLATRWPQPRNAKRRWHAPCS